MTDDLRTDQLTGTQVIIVPDRQERPNLPNDGCPFCVGGREAPTPYDVAAFTNRWPSLDEGRAEVVLFSPRHDESLGSLESTQLRQVVDLWTERTTALGARDDVAYVLIFENRGAEVGATIDHPHGQIYAFGALPPVPDRELALATARGSCALCDEEPGARLVAEVGSWRAWVPAASGHPYGVIIAPHRHIGSLEDLDEGARNDLAGILGKVLGGLDVLFDEATPYVWWMHQRPTDNAAWPWAHLHIEVVPHRRARGVSRFVAGAEMGSGTLLNSVDPTDAARSLHAACASRGEP